MRVVLRTTPHTTTAYIVTDRISIELSHRQRYNIGHSNDQKIFFPNEIFARQFHIYTTLFYTSLYMVTPLLNNMSVDHIIEIIDQPILGLMVVFTVMPSIALSLEGDEFEFEIQISFDTRTKMTSSEMF